jgi:hypothetical protein
MLGVFFESDRGFAKARNEAILDAALEPERRYRMRQSSPQSSSSNSTED